MHALINLQSSPGYIFKYTLISKRMSARRPALIPHTFIIKIRKHLFQQVCKHPEGFNLRHFQQQCTSHNIHALTIAVYKSSAIYDAHTTSRTHHITHNTSYKPHIHHTCTTHMPHVPHTYTTHTVLTTYTLHALHTHCTRTTLHTHTHTTHATLQTNTGGGVCSACEEAANYYNTMLGYPIDGFLTA